MIQSLAKILLVLTLYCDSAFAGGPPPPPPPPGPPPASKGAPPAAPVASPPAYSPPASYTPPAAAPPVTYPPVSAPLAAAPPSSPSASSSNSGVTCPAPTPPTEPPVVLTAFTNNGSMVAALEAPIVNLVQAAAVKYIGYSLYQQPPVTVPTTAGSSAHTDPGLNIVSNHSLYCSPQLSAESGSAGFVCTPQTSGLTGNDAAFLQMGDVSTYVLLESTWLSPAVATAAQVLMRNLIHPVPDSKFRSGYNPNIQTPQDFAARLADAAILSVSVESLVGMYSMRTSSSVLGVASGGTNSKLSIMANEATRRFEQTDTGTLTSGTAPFGQVLLDPNITELGALKHLAAMKAFKLWMDYQRFRQGERIEALLAATLAKTIVSNDAQDLALKKATGNG